MDLKKAIQCFETFKRSCLSCTDKCLFGFFKLSVSYTKLLLPIKGSKGLKLDKFNAHVQFYWALGIKTVTQVFQSAKCHSQIAIPKSSTKNYSLSKVVNFTHPGTYHMPTSVSSYLR